MLNLTINAASTYGGGTVMNASNVTLNAVNAFGTGLTTVNGGVLTVNTDGALNGSVDLTGGTLVANGANILAANPVELSGGTLDLRNNGSADMILPSLTVSGTSALNFAKVSTASTTLLTIPLIDVSGNTFLTLTNGSGASPLLTGFHLTGDLTIDNSSTTRLLSITEDGTPRRLLKTGNGVLELEGASSHSGGTEILSGVLQVEHNDALGSGSLTIGDTSGTSSATARFTSGLTIGNDIIVRAGSSGTMTIDSSVGNVTWNGSLSLAKDVSLDNGSGVSSYDGLISGSGVVTKIGNGEMILGNAANSFTGDIAISAGILTVASDGALGDLGNSVFVSNARTFKADGSFATSRAFDFAGSSGTVNVSTGAELTFNSGITGTAAITKSGLGDLTFGPAADSSARGAVTTTISDGIVRLRNPNNLSAGGLINLNTSANTLALAADADTDFVHPVVANGSGAVIDVDRAPGGSGSNGRHALGEVSTTSGKLTVTGANGYGLTLDKYSMTSSPSLINDAPGALRVGDVEGSPGASSRTLTISGAGDIEITGGISEIAGTGSYGFTKTGVGNFRFGTSISDFARIATVNEGTLDLNGLSYAVEDVTLGATSSASGAHIVTGAGGSLDLADVLTFSSSGNPVGATITGNLGLGSTPHTFVVNNSSNAAADLTIDGTITGGVGGTISKTSTGTLRFTGAGNTHAGLTSITAGVLEMGKSSGNAIGTGGLFVTNSTVSLLAANQINDAAPVTVSGFNDTLLEMNGFSDTLETDRDHPDGWLRLQRHPHRLHRHARPWRRPGFQQQHHQRH